MPKAIRSREMACAMRAGAGILQRKSNCRNGWKQGKGQRRPGEGGKYKESAVGSMGTLGQLPRKVYQQKKRSGLGSSQTQPGNRVRSAEGRKKR